MPKSFAIRTKSSSVASTRTGNSRHTSISRTPASRSSASSRPQASGVRSRRPRRVHVTAPQRSQSATSSPAEPRRENESADDEGLDQLDEIIMAIDLRDRGTVGCAYYVAREETLYFMEDVKLGGLDVVDALKFYIDPTVILVSARADDTVVERLDPEPANRDNADEARDQFRLPYLLEVRPSPEFNYEAATGKLVSLRLGTEAGPQVTFITPGDVVAADGYADHEDGDFAGQQGQLLRLAGWIDTESRLTVGCAGAVIAYLQRRRASGYLPGDAAASQFFRISTVEMFSLSGSMYLVSIPNG